MANTNIQPGAAAAVATGNAPTQSWGVFPAGPPLALPSPPAINIVPLTGRLSASGYRAPVPLTVKAPSVEALIRAFYARNVSTIFDSSLAASFGVENSPALIWDDALPDGQQQVVDVSSRMNHAIQVVGLTPGEALRVQGSMNGSDYFTISAALDSITANGYIAWTGLTKFLKASRAAAGAPGQAQIFLMSRT